MILQHPRSTGARWCALALPTLLGALVPACLVDLEQRCGENQRYDENLAVCVCDGDYALQGTTCEPCGTNEVGALSGCECLDGFARATPDADCEPLAGLAQACESDADCGDPRYGYCYVPPGADGYCTSSGCSTASDCPTDYGCNTRQAPAVCEQPPSGLGQACTASSECEDYTASYCETVSAHACLVNDCLPDPGRCHGDWVCCDIGLLTQSLCLPPDQLEDGNCPAGGTLIPRRD